MMTNKIAVAATIMSGNWLFKTFRFATTRSPAERSFPATIGFIWQSFSWYRAN
jgi:hypothetical protein